MNRIRRSASQISRQIVGALKVTLSPEEDRKPAERKIDDIQAYNEELGPRMLARIAKRTGLTPADPEADDSAEPQ